MLVKYEIQIESFVKVIFRLKLQKSGNDEAVPANLKSLNIITENQLDSRFS